MNHSWLRCTVVPALLCLACTVSAHPQQGRRSNAFKAELLLEGADQFDIRYDVIMWVEGENRAFSNGLSVIDPRTGEILKGEVTLTAGASGRTSSSPTRCSRPTARW
jgi:hypothetical protein